MHLSQISERDPRTSRSDRETRMGSEQLQTLAIGFFLRKTGARDSCKLTGWKIAETEGSG